MKKLDVLITSGGTICKIDDIRHVGNFSSGTTGAIIAEEFLKKGHNVHYLYAKNAKRPFRRGMSLNPLENINKELTKLKDIYAEFKDYESSLKEYPFSTFQNYHDSVKEFLINKKVDVVILAAAVSDYGSKKIEGKISSNQNELNFKLTRNPKVISLVKKWDPNVFQVGFKLLSNVDLKELVDTAYKHGASNNSDLTVANSIKMGDFMESQTVIITPKKKVVLTKRHELAEKLYNILKNRMG